MFDKWMSPREITESREMMARFRVTQERNSQWYWDSLSKECGKKMTCRGDIYEEIDRVETLSRTCKKCNLILPDYDKLARHKDSTRCRKRIAEINGDRYVPKHMVPKLCTICNKTILTNSWSRHIQSKKHRKLSSQQKLQKLFCTVCGKDFSKKSRPKRAYAKHLKNKVHLRKVAAAAVSLVIKRI